jgi:hypothetical protein
MLRLARSSGIRLCQFWSGKVRINQVASGWARLDLVITG